MAIARPRQDRHVRRDLQKAKHEQPLGSPARVLETIKSSHGISASDAELINRAVIEAREASIADFASD